MSRFSSRRSCSLCIFLALAELVRQGYARVYSDKSCEIDKKLWNTYYEEARQNNRGLFAILGEVPDAAAYRRQNHAPNR